MWNLLHEKTQQYYSYFFFCAFGISIYLFIPLFLCLFILGKKIVFNLGTCFFFLLYHLMVHRSHKFQIEQKKKIIKNYLKATQYRRLGNIFLLKYNQTKIVRLNSKQLT